MPPLHRAGEWLRRHWVVVAIVAVSAVLHLWQLGRRPLAHDEAIDAWFSWQARNFGVMRYDPVYHGPLRFYLEGLVLHLGTSAFWARLLAATAGIVATAVIATSHRILGRVGAPVAAVLFTISPTALTVTRTGREDALVALVSLALLLLVARILVEPRGRDIVAAGTLLAISFGLKETTFLFGLAACAFVVGGFVAAFLRPGGECRAALRRVVAIGRYPWIWALIAFTVTFMVIFTSGFRYAEGFRSGLVDGVDYWWSQHDVRRGGQPWFFYLVIYGAYEWLVTALAAAGIYAAVKRRSLPLLWLGWMACAQLVLYSWAGEKFAWLALHPLLPAVLLAGVGAEAVLRHAREPSWRPAIVALAGAAALMTLVIAVRPAITDGADPRELLVTVQTSDDVPPIVDRLRSGRADGALDSILIDSSDSGSWPWAWYLHGVDGVEYVDVDPAAVPTDHDAVVVVGVGGGPPTVPEGYDVERFASRVWWSPEYGDADIGAALRWFFTRQPWSPTGSLDTYLLTRE